MGARWAVGLTENIAQVDSRTLGDFRIPIPRPLPGTQF